MLLQLDPDGQRLEVRFAYDEKLVDLVRGLPGRRWHPTGKYWSVPARHLEEVARTLIPLGFKAADSVRERMESGGDEEAQPDATPTASEPPGDLSPGFLFEPPSSLAAEEPGTFQGTPPPEVHTFSVEELNQRVRRVLEDAFAEPVWVQGEVIGFDRNSHKNHVYFQLAEKDEEEDRPRAVVTAVLFASARRDIERLLARSAEPLAIKDGIRIRALGRVDLYPRSGSYQVVLEAIDPEFTLGEIARNRERVLGEVERLGLRERNLVLPFPVPCLRVGLVTSLGSDAYNDFVNEVQRSDYPFVVDVFDCHVQGARMESDVLRAFDYFASTSPEYDVLVIVRGGGSRTDLMGFDSLPLAVAVARHPLKVVVGIGHQRDRSVLDFIAHSEKTPTAVAQKLVELARLEEERIRSAAEALSRLSLAGVERERERVSRSSLVILRTLEVRLERAASFVRLASERVAGKSQRVFREQAREFMYRSERLSRGIQVRLDREQERWQDGASDLERTSSRILERARERLESWRQRARGADPARILSRGFAWLKAPDGKSLKDVGSIRPGDVIRARLRDGEIAAQVNEVRPDAKSDD